VRALREYQKKLIDGNVTIFVRRAGPNYQEGLRIMRELGKMYMKHIAFNLYVLLMLNDHLRKSHIMNSLKKASIVIFIGSVPNSHVYV